MKKKVLITGIFGQDGSILAEKLYKEKYDIYGIKNITNSKNSKRNFEILKKKKIKFKLLNVDLFNYESLRKNLIKVNPNIIFHLSAYHSSSEVKIRNDDKIMYKNILPVLHFLDILKKYLKKTKFINAGSCLMYDNSIISPQNEKLKWQSLSPYGIAKIVSANFVKYYRENHKIFSVTPILYNHESSRRGEQFVTQKIISNMIKIKQKKIKSFKLGNLNTIKDWSHANDIMDALILISKSKEPIDYIVSSGKGRTIMDFVKTTARVLGILDYKKVIKIDKNLNKSNFSRTKLVGNSKLIKKNLKWKNKISFEEMITEMIENRLLQR